MKRVLGFVFMVLLLVPFMVSVTPAHAMDAEEAAVHVEAAYQTVQNTLAALQAAMDSRDVQKIDLALQALDLAIANYAVASESLARIQAGELVDDTVFFTCSSLGNELNNFCKQLAANDLAGARASFAAAQGLAASQPAPANPGAIPAGLADLEAQIITLSADAVTAIRDAGGTVKTLGTTDASPI